MSYYENPDSFINKLGTGFSMAALVGVVWLLAQGWKWIVSVWTW